MALSQDVLIAILTVSVPAIVAVASIIIAWQTEKLRTMREQLSEKKCNAYADAVQTFYSILKDTKKGNQIDTNALMQKMIDSKRDIFLYGSDDVFLAFNEWLVNLSKPWQFNAYLKFILSIRKDICGKTKLNEDDILLNLTQDKEELRKFKEMMKPQE